MEPSANNLERIVMPGDESWEHMGYDMTANSLTVAEGFEPISPPPQKGMETAEDFMQRAVLRDELRVNILQRRLQKGLGAVQLDWRFTKAEKVRKPDPCNDKNAGMWPSGFISTGLLESELE